MIVDAALAAFVAALVPGLSGPAAGATCGGSYSALGTSNISGKPSHVSTADTSVVNIWVVQNKKNEHQGWIIKTLNGAYWYGAPIGLKAQEIDDAYASRLTSGEFHMIGCFKADLDKKYIIPR